MEKPVLSTNFTIQDIHILLNIGNSISMNYGNRINPNLILGSRLS